MWVYTAEDDVKPTVNPVPNLKHNSLQTYTLFFSYYQESLMHRLNCKMHNAIVFLAILALTNAHKHGSQAPCSTTTDYALPCYSTPLPELPPSVIAVNRSIPWASPTFILPNGTLCCDSLTEVRDRIDAVDTQILNL